MRPETCFSSLCLGTRKAPAMEDRRLSRGDESAGRRGVAPLTIHFPASIASFLISRCNPHGILTMSGELRNAIVS